MLRTLSATFKVSLAMMFAVLSSGIMPAASVYASDLIEAQPGTYLPVWCQKTGPTWNAVPGNDSTTANKNRQPLLDENGAQVTVHDATEISEYDIACNDLDGDNNIVTPAAPQVMGIEECGQYGYITLPTDTEFIVYTLTNGNGGEGEFTVTATPQENSELDVTGTEYVLQDNGTATFAGNLGVHVECEQPPVLTVCESFERIQATNQNFNDWTLGNGAEFVEGGVELSSPGEWTSSTISRPMSGTLAELGTGVNYTPHQDYLGLHVQTAEGNLVYEDIYGGNWWLNTSTATPNMINNAPHTGGGQGSNYYGTLEEWAQAFPELEVQKLTVLYTSPVENSTVVTSVKIGCKEYTFDYERTAEECTLESEKFTQPWGEGNPEAAGWDYDTNDYGGEYGSINFTNEGLHISTPAEESYVTGSFSANNTHIADVDAMSYQTFRKEISAGYENTLPAYILYIDLNGDEIADKYFFYEPYYNGEVKEGEWQTWDAYDDGNAIWYVSGTSQKLVSWNEILNDPLYKDARVLEFGFNQGTSNAETFAIIQDLTFDCATMSFAVPEDDTDEEPETPVAPVTPTTPTTPGNVLGDSDIKEDTPEVLGVQTPEVLPATGNTESSLHLIGAVLAALTYAVMYRRETADQV